MFFDRFLDSLPQTAVWSAFGADFSKEARGEKYGNSSPMAINTCALVRSEAFSNSLTLSLSLSLCQEGGAYALGKAISSGKTCGSPFVLVCRLQFSASGSQLLQVSGDEDSLIID